MNQELVKLKKSLVGISSTKYRPFRFLVFFAAIFFLFFVSQEQSLSGTVKALLLAVFFGSLAEFLFVALFFRGFWRYLSSCLSLALFCIFYFLSLNWILFLRLGLPAFLAFAFGALAVSALASGFIVYRLFWLLANSRFAFGRNQNSGQDFVANKIPKKGKVFLFGTDGASWEFLLPLVESGRLPNFKKVIEQGSFGFSRPFLPTITPAIWTSIATGLTVEGHGIGAFTVVKIKGFKPFVWRPSEAGLGTFYKLLEKAGLAQISPVTSNFRKADAVWNSASDFGFKVGVFNWPVTWPAEKVNGFMVSQNYCGKAKGQFFPRSLQADVIKTPKWAGDLDFFLTLFKQFSPELALFYSQGVDEAQHQYLKYSCPGLFFFLDAKKARKEGKFIEEAYIEEDRKLGEILKILDKESFLVVLSDHGIEPTPPFVRRRSGEHRLAPPGLAIFFGPGVNKNKFIGSVSVLDIAPTIFYLLGLPVPVQFKGSLFKQAFSKDFLESRPVKFFKPGKIGRHKPSRVLHSSDDEAMVKRLKKLGYF